MTRMKIICTVLVFLLLAASVVSATSNENLPDKSKVDDFISEMKGSSASDVFDKVKEEHKDWNADLLKCTTCEGNTEAVGLYYKDQGSYKGYASIYYADGKIVSPSDLHGYKTTESYIGELEDSKDSPEQEKVCESGSCNKDTNASQSENVTVETTKLTMKDRKAAFMAYVETKDSVTLEEVQEELDKCFPDELEV